MRFLNKSTEFALEMNAYDACKCILFKIFNENYGLYILNSHLSAHLCIADF